jgi:glycine cleavage system H protein
MREIIYFTASHEWCAVEGEVATIGITEHAQAQLGDIVYVDLPEVDDITQPGDEIAVVESVKTAADIYAPVAGTVIEVNTQLLDNPGLINASPMGDGWLYRCAITDLSADLLSAEEYDAIIEAD